MQRWSDIVSTFRAATRSRCYGAFYRAATAPGSPAAPTPKAHQSKPRPSVFALSPNDLQTRYSVHQTALSRPSQVQSSLREAARTPAQSFDRADRRCLKRKNRRVLECPVLPSQRGRWRSTIGLNGDGDTYRLSYRIASAWLESLHRHNPASSRQIDDPKPRIRVPGGHGPAATALPASS